MLIICFQSGMALVLVEGEDRLQALIGSSNSSGIHKTVSGSISYHAATNTAAFLGSMVTLSLILLYHL